MVQTRDKIAASLVVAAMVAFGVVVAPTAIDPKANAQGAAEAITDESTPLVGMVDESIGSKSVHEVADTFINVVPDEVVDNGDGTETATVKGNDAVTKVTDEGTDGLGDSVQIIVAPSGTY